MNVLSIVVLAIVALLAVLWASRSWRAEQDQAHINAIIDRLEREPAYLETVRDRLEKERRR